MQGGDPIDDIIRRDPRYSAEAYRFVMDALSYTIHQIGERRHVTGRELLFGIRDFALDCWGLMARHVLDAWGVRSTDDFGEIVFNLINAGILSKTDRDSKDDFKNVYGFLEAFDKSYSPELDKYGHIRRKIPPMRPAPWVPLIGDTGFN